jgi:hypothetical protein
MKLFISLFLPLFLSITGYGVGYRGLEMLGAPGGNKMIEVPDNATIGDLKQALIERHNLDNIPFEALRIIYGGREMENDESVTAIRENVYVSINPNFRVRGANTKSANN